MAGPPRAAGPTAAHPAAGGGGARPARQKGGRSERASDLQASWIGTSGLGIWTSGLIWRFGLVDLGLHLFLFWLNGKPHQTTKPPGCIVGARLGTPFEVGLNEKATTYAHVSWQNGD